jgi:hypothetical protein
MPSTIYSVTVVDRDSGRMQRVLVESCCPNGMQDFVAGIPDLDMQDPVVVDVIATRLQMSGSLS